MRSCLSGSGAHGANDGDETRDHHRERKQRAHGETAEEIAELRIGLAELLAGDARKAVAGDEETADHAGTFQRAHARGGDSDGEENDAFERSFIKLARVARIGPAIRENYSPRHVRDAAA